MNISNFSSQRPYLLRAFYEWLLDNYLTPYIIIDLNVTGVIMPAEFSNRSQIILNINPCAVKNLKLGNDEVEFNTCFKGTPFQVKFPVLAVLAIYAHENGIGTIFESRINYKQLELYNNTENLNKKNVMSIINNCKFNNLKIQDSKDHLLLNNSGRPSLHVIK